MDRMSLIYFLFLTFCSSLVVPVRTKSNDHSLLNENATLVQDESAPWNLIDKIDLEDDNAAPFSANDIIFQLFTRANPKRIQNLTLNDHNILKYFNPKLPTRILIHGWYSQGSLTQGFADAYLKRGDFNFIAVNWQKGSDIINYRTARKHIKIVGMHVAHFIDCLIAKGLSPKLLALIGHSLGAHAMGIG